MDVVDDKHHATTCGGDLAHEVDEALQREESNLAVGQDDRWPRHRPLRQDQLQAPVIHRGWRLRAGLGPQPRTQRFGDDAKAHRGADAGPADEDGETAPSGVEHRLVQQARLADPTFAGEKQAVRGAHGGGLYDAPKPLQVSLAPNHHRGPANAPFHAASLTVRYLRGVHGCRCGRTGARSSTPARTRSLP